MLTVRVKLYAAIQHYGTIYCFAYMMSRQVSAKNQSKVQVRKTLNALVWLIKANHPDTAPAELRKWGFQKEKY